MREYRCHIRHLERMQNVETIIEATNIRRAARRIRSTYPDHNGFTVEDN